MFSPESRGPLDNYGNENSSFVLRFGRDSAEENDGVLHALNHSYTGSSQQVILHVDNGTSFNHSLSRASSLRELKERLLMHKKIDVGLAQREAGAQDAQEEKAQREISDEEEAEGENECDITGRLTFTRIEEEEEAPSKTSTGRAESSSTRGPTQQMPIKELMSMAAGSTETLRGVFNRPGAPMCEGSFSGASSIHSEGKMHVYAWEEGEEEKVPSKASKENLGLFRTNNPVQRAKLVSHVKPIQPGPKGRAKRV